MLVTVKRANVLLDVEDTEVQRYVAMGYDVINESGVVVQKAIPTDLGELRLAYVQNAEKIKELEAEIKSLKAKATRVKKEA